MHIVFMGTPAFAVPSLECLVDAGYTPVAVVTAPDRPRGRGRVVSGTPVKEAAARLGIPLVLQPESVKDPQFAAAIAELKADILVVVAFRILPPAVFKEARLGAFNLHGSLLPRYRGAAPIHHAIMNGDEQTGVTTFFLKEKVDTGSMIMQRGMSIGPDETTGEVHDRMMHLGADVVLDTVRQIEAGTATGLPQDDTLATPAPKVYREQGLIDWSRPVRRVHNHVRGLSPVPGAWTTWGEHNLKVYRTRLVDDPGFEYEQTACPGTVVEAGPRLLVVCTDGVIELVTVQPEGGRKLAAASFMNGHDLNIGDVFGAK